MEELIIGMALVIIGIGAGYFAGFRAGYDYLMEELKKEIGRK